VHDVEGEHEVERLELELGGVAPLEADVSQTEPERICLRARDALVRAVVADDAAR
jgi:hypothetical protein